MTLFSNLQQLVTGLFLMLTLTACSDDDDAITPPVVETNTIADFVASNDNYSSLAAALEVAGLTSTLDGSDNYTVFAPNNDAFATFLEDNGFSSLSEVPVNVLREILLNHVQMGEIMASDLSTGYIESMATSQASDTNLSLYISTANGVMINGVSTVTAANIEVDNGVIHAVDEVIGLPTVVTFALADPTFEILVAALTREDDFTFVTTLMESGSPAPFTVFAPTNDAFADLLEELEMNSLADIPEDVLASTLAYHVAPGANVRSSMLSDNMQVGTLAQQTFTINLSNEGATITDANGRPSSIVVVDVQANNGVVHVIDTVLLPAM